jgi:transcriptional regulator with XRE-family HTH domain
MNNNRHPPTMGKLRVAYGLDQAQLARELNVSPAAICRWEKSERLPRRDYVKKILAFFNTAEEINIAGVIFGNPYYEGGE